MLGWLIANPEIAGSVSTFAMLLLMLSGFVYAAVRDYRDKRAGVHSVDELRAMLRERDENDGG